MGKILHLATVLNLQIQTRFRIQRAIIHPFSDFFSFFLRLCVFHGEEESTLPCLAHRPSVKRQRDSTWGAWLPAKYCAALFAPWQSFCHWLKIQCYLLSQTLLPSAYTWLWQWLCGDCSCVPNTNYYSVQWPERASIFKLHPSFSPDPQSHLLILLKCCDGIRNYWCFLLHKGKKNVWYHKNLSMHPSIKLK